MRYLYKIDLTIDIEILNNIYYFLFNNRNFVKKLYKIDKSILEPWIIIEVHKIIGQDLFTFSLKG